VEASAARAENQADFTALVYQQLFENKRCAQRGVREVPKAGL